MSGEAVAKPTLRHALGARAPYRHTAAFLTALVLSAAGWAQHKDIPDQGRTPGAVDPDITQENIAHTVCVAGYTKTVRPPTRYTDRLKRRQMRELGLEGSARDYQEDHLVPLCVGGAPRDPHNLWPQPLNGRWSAAMKDQLESSVCRQVCRGEITLKQGQAIFLQADWVKAYLRFFGLDAGALDASARSSRCCS
jgi:hypothetical protein